MAFSGLFIFSGAVNAHHVSDELDLRPGDESDPCVDDGLQIRVTVNGVTHQGIMKLELYASEKNFLNKKGRLRWTRVEAQDGPMRLCLDVPEPGTYAVAGYHDLDGNRKLNKKWDFTPKEPFGLSNDPKLKRRKFPKFKNSAFEVPEAGADITLNLVDVGKKKDKKDD